MKLVNRAEATLAEALTRVTKDPDLKEAFFTTPLALTTTETPQKFAKYNSKGHQEGNYKGKGKGKGKQFGKSGNKGGKSYNKGKHGDLSLVSQTPDGRDICFAYSSQGCAGKCGRVHVCRVKGCYGDHAAREHHKMSSSGKKPE